MSQMGDSPHSLVFGNLCNACTVYRVWCLLPHERRRTFNVYSAWQKWIRLNEIIFTRPAHSFIRTWAAFRQQDEWKSAEDKSQQNECWWCQNQHLLISRLMQAHAFSHISYSISKSIPFTSFTARTMYAVRTFIYLQLFHIAVATRLWLRAAKKYLC